MGDNNGAYGLMQITQDKCTSGIDCSDPDYNVKTGTYVSFAVTGAESVC